MFPDTHLKKWKIGKAEKWLVDNAKDIGIDIDGFEHEITNHFKNHVLKKHGNKEKEMMRGQIAVIEEDFEKISDVVKNPDHAMIGAKRNGKDVFYYVKKMEDGTTLYVEEVLNSDENKSLRSKTMFKRGKDVNKDKLKNIVSMNNKTDITNSKIISPGTGSNPSYKAENPPMAANPIQPTGQLSTLVVTPSSQNVKGTDK